MAKRKGDLISLIIIFVLIVIFVPLIVKYLNSMFGPIVSGFENMITPPSGIADMAESGADYSNPFVIRCRNPCSEGQFCTKNLEGEPSCVDISVRGGNGDVVGQYN
jgi:hypothetical protein